MAVVIFDFQYLFMSMLLKSLFASVPIVLILLLMVGFRWGAARAGAVGWAAAVAIAFLRFGATPEVLAFSQLKALLLTADVLYIVWTAFLLFKVVEEAGAIESIGEGLRGLTPDRGLQGLLVGWCFASFLQGVGGYGVPVAVTAPLLIGLGFPPLQAVILPSVGHAWSVTFGSLGASFQALMAATGLPGEVLAPPAARILGLSGLLCGALAAHASGGAQTVRRLWITIGVLGLAMSTVQYALAVSGFWNLGGTGAGLAGLGLGLLVARLRRDRARESTGGTTTRLAGQEASLALGGYAILVTLLLVSQLAPTIKQVADRVVISVQFPALVTLDGYSTPAGPGREISVFGHTGAVLLYSSALAYLVYRRAGQYRPGAVRRILSATWRGTARSSLGILAMMGMAVMMSHAGMTEALAQALAQGVGGAFPVVSPLIGALGAFMTGSNTNSNAVFATLQLRTAGLLSLSVPVILAAQTSGAALASVLAPAKIVVGAGTAGLAGEEGAILRRLLPYLAVLLAIVSLLTWAMTR